MWCRHCQQETPALGPLGASGPRCGRCQRTSPTSDARSVAELPENGDDARRAIYQSLRSAHATLSAGEAAPTFRFDLAQTPLQKAMAPNRREPLGRRSTISRPLPSPSLPSSPRGQFAAWLIASLGAAFVGLGIGLGGWSLVGERPELWNPALAATLGGQGLLIIGLLQLLASLWNAARHATQKLSQMHEELRRVRRATEETAGRNQPTAAAFYANAAREASPEMLLGSLRGQLDRLASRLR